MTKEEIEKAADDLDKAISLLNSAIPHTLYDVNHKWYHFKTLWQLPQPIKEDTPADEFYPGYRYQRLFNYLADLGVTALQGEMNDIIQIVEKDFTEPFKEEDYKIGQWESKHELQPTKNKVKEDTPIDDDVTKAAKELLHLHSCEQEGLSSGKPTREQWLTAVDNLSNALYKT